MGFDELNNELHRRQIAATGNRRLSAANRNLIWPRPPSATLRPPHLLVHLLTDRPALSPIDGCHELRKHDRLDLDLRKQQFTGEMSLQCRLTDRLAIIALDAKANTIFRHAARNKKFDDGSVFIRRDKWWPANFSLRMLFILFVLFIFHASISLVNAISRPRRLPAFPH